jgi:hypothetical protein
MKRIYYRVWVQNEYCDTYKLFDRISEEELEPWLRENAECTHDFGKDVWIMSHYKTLGLPNDIPENGMGYIVKFEKMN